MPNSEFSKQLNFYEIDKVDIQHILSNINDFYSSTYPKRKRGIILNIKKGYLKRLRKKERRGREREREASAYKSITYFYDEPPVVQVFGQHLQHLQHFRHFFV